MADFVGEFTSIAQGLEFEPSTSDQLEEPNTAGPAQIDRSNDTNTNDASSSGTTINDSTKPAWILFVDGSSNGRGSSAGVVLTNPNELKLEQSFRFNFPTSNNGAEYEALLVDLKLAKTVGADRSKARSVLQMIVSQIKGKYAAKDEKITVYLDKVRELIKDFAYLEIQQLPRSANTQADALANLGSTTIEEWCRKIYVEFLADPSIGGIPFVDTSIYESNQGSEISWMDPIMDYILHRTLPT